MVGVAEGSDPCNEATDVELPGEIVLFQKLAASSRKFDDMPDEGVARAGDAVRCGSHHMDCLSAQCAFQSGDKASSPEIDSGSSVTDNPSVGIPGAREPFPGVEGGELPGAGSTGVEDRVGFDGNPDPVISAGCPLESLMAPLYDTFHQKN